MISDHASNGQVVGFMGSVMRVPLSNWIEYGSGKPIISLFRPGTAQKSLICVEKVFFRFSYVRNYSTKRAA